jgi:tetratricopeptide (TPR) repeat protein
MPVRPLSAPGLADCAARAQGYPQALVAVGVLRLARRFDEAGRLLARSDTPAEWRDLHANEEAALAWHAGRAEEALALWQAQEPAVPVLFNRGMAALFLGQAAAARPALAQAVEALPETSPWHHLGHLYLALASSRP